MADVDGNIESRDDAISVLNGPSPTVRAFGSAEEECAAVGAWLAERITEAISPGEIAVFVRSDAELPRAMAAVRAGGLAPMVLDAEIRTDREKASIATMHLAKGLEFRAVAVPRGSAPTWGRSE